VKIALSAWLLAAAAPIWAQAPTTLPDPDAIALDAAADLVSRLAAQYPRVSAALFLVGILRVLLKPLVAAAHRYAEASARPEDRAALERIERSPATRAALFLLDWLASIKFRR
jgi:hypothetical protein